MYQIKFNGCNLCRVTTETSIGHQINLLVQNTKEGNEEAYKVQITILQKGKGPKKFTWLPSDIDGHLYVDSICSRYIGSLLEEIESEKVDLVFDAML